ncbi:MAG: group II intron reverse transcriptase/maturase [Firmicutes bacterium]|nr:group II intron reverse transcriptase/maturase [Bacillota bacterium]
MAASEIAGAVSHRKVDWEGIDWDKARRNVRRLQARIVKATKEGRWGKVKTLQRLLTHSFSGKALAVKRVTENKGKRTPGVDGVIWDTPKKKEAAIHSLGRRGYRPQPLRRMYIPKSDGKKKRPLGIPVMFDRACQALYLLALDPVAETMADPNSYGFRVGRSTADAIKQCFIALARKDSAGWVLEGDIKSCFDKISHDWLFANVPLDRKVLWKWLKAGFIERRILYPTEEGTPQGGIISPALANVALNGLEKRLRDAFPSKSAYQAAKVHLIRYADDFVITGSSKELLENKVKPVVEQFLEERGLELSQEKTVTTHIEDGFDFLGQNVRKYKGKLLIKPSKKNVKAFLRKVRKVIKGHPTQTAGELIQMLASKIRGWVNFHRHAVSKETFSKVDREIFLALWNWAVRRHPDKSKEWIRAKYFKTVGNRSWVFYGEVYGKELHLPYAADTPIERHVKVKGEANPYDPEWEGYFKKRKEAKEEDDQEGPGWFYMPEEP